MKQKTTGAIILIIIAVVVVILFDDLIFDRGPATPDVEVTDFEPGADLPNFPDDVSFPEESEAVKTFTALAEDGDFQSTQIIEVEEPLVNVFSDYQEFFENSPDWTIISQLFDAENPSHAALFAQNETGIMNINFNGTESSTFIDLSFTEN